MTEAAVIVDALRTPMGRGKPDGGLAGLHPVDLLAALLKETVQRHDIDPGLVDDVMIGCVSQSGEQSATPGRMALLAAGFPEHVPSTTIDRKCGSSQQAVHFAAQSIMAGANQLVIAGGVESMSRVPMGSARMGQDPFGQGVQQRYAPGLVSQGVAAELVTSRYQLDRETLDQYAAQSHQRAAAHREAGAFRDEIVPVTLPDGSVLSEDETIRPATTAERLSELRPSFQDDALKQRFPEINWSITAGNASQITDGASALLIMSESLANKLGLKPLARFVSFDVCGDSPLTMLTAPIPSSKRALQKAGMSVDQIDHFEVNEAFAPVPLAWRKELGADPERLNPRGGAIALGHPLGASGARLMTTLVHALGQNGQRYGLQTMCEAGGMANTTIIERL
ncbi:3-ketoacyl-CoA thiolase [Alcanivorax balearicus MACL04]|uniref:3-ketoacyl-CoA thiolase n=1 Tax=Alloalcanivorax balearicus MACL04 TaxID=1177182 RepID=A0ABT2QX24_9GAMM|nr:thiolase family protein [Alloalcanivorax balearicus]MCU5782063.1 3-ketoacyl-CoA thiolase [Alloalcanivorax balearicus MACL04]